MFVCVDEFIINLNGYCLVSKFCVHIKKMFHSVDRGFKEAYKALLRQLKVLCHILVYFFSLYIKPQY